MRTRTISYIDPDEDILDIEVANSMEASMEQNLSAYFRLVASNIAMSGMNIYQLPKNPSIYYMENE